ncbi:unnamed protein product [Ambrosiozyma monospora]|uniref:Unnamed protein product n=1 Tax=Ambrosiozyma monospora TaxID=43982 RepID=A0ACB5T939_AMBMO|nr:unnamed protein product [Ambrosiozyma monospora]
MSFDNKEQQNLKEKQQPPSQMIPPATQSQELPSGINNQQQQQQQQTQRQTTGLSTASSTPSASVHDYTPTENITPSPDAEDERKTTRRRSSIFGKNKGNENRPRAQTYASTMNEHPPALNSRNDYTEHHEDDDVLSMLVNDDDDDDDDSINEDGNNTRNNLNRTASNSSRLTRKLTHALSRTETKVKNEIKKFGYFDPDFKKGRLKIYGLAAYGYFVLFVLILGVFSFFWGSMYHREYRIKNFTFAVLRDDPSVYANLGIEDVFSNALTEATQVARIQAAGNWKLRYYTNYTNDPSKVYEVMKEQIYHQHYWVMPTMSCLKLVDIMLLSIPYWQNQLLAYKL